MPEHTAELQKQIMPEQIRKTEFGERKIPTSIVGPHNLAFACWAEGLQQGHIEKGATLVHIDTHFDGNYPIDTAYQKLDLDNPRDVRNAAEGFSIMEFIGPAKTLGIVGDVIWVSPRTFDEKPFEYAILVPHDEETIDTNSFQSKMKPLTDPKKLIVDVDIDYFMHGNTSEEDFQKVRDVMDKAGLITIATSPKPLTDQMQANLWVDTLLKK